MRSIALLLLALVGASALGQTPDSVFKRELQPELMRADFGLFQSALEKIHPALLILSAGKQKAGWTFATRKWSLR